MTLKEVLKSKNANGEPYLCDIKKWLKDNDPYEIQRLLKEMQKFYEQRP